MKNKKNKEIKKSNLPKHNLREKHAIFNTHILLLFFLIIITFIIFSGALNHEFTNWDDNHYVTHNALIREIGVENTVKIFKSFVHSHYHPLTILSLAVDYHFWGLNPKGYIIVNILLHICNVVLVYFILKLMTTKHLVVFGAALIFAIHPMKVESVVWITERKDVLYAFFYLLALYSYVKYVTTGFVKKYYFITLLMFILSLLSKALAASLPLVLLLFDYYYARKNYRKLIIEKIPFFLLSLLFGIVAMLAQSGETPNNHPFLVHLFLISYTLVFYVIKFFVPLFQSVLIEFPEKTSMLLPLKYYLSFLFFPLLIYLFYKLKNHRRQFIFCVGFFLSTIILILIKFPVGPAYIAERYTYMPYLGLSFLISIFINHFYNSSYRKLVLIIFVAWLMFLSFRTYNHIKVWENSESLWTNVLKCNPKSVIAFNNRGDARYEKGDFAGAIKDYSKALEINAKAAGAYNNRGNAKKQINNLAAALLDYNKAIEIDSVYFDAYYNRAITKDLLGDTMGALADFDKAIILNPDYADTYYNRANIKFKIGQIKEAIKDYDKTIEINPKQADAYCNRGGAKYKLKDFINAEKDYNTAIKLNPSYANAYNNRAVLRFEQGDIYNACLDWQQSTKNGNTTAQQLFESNCK